MLDFVTVQGSRHQALASLSALLGPATGDGGEALPVGGVGSKVAAGRDQPLIAMMPPHGTCIETHPGGGAIMKRKPPAGGDPGGLFGAMFAWPGWSLSEASCP